LHAARTGAGVEIGFIERGGARMIAISECPAMAPQLYGAIGALRELARQLAPARGELTLHCLWTETGLDVSVKGAGRASSLSGAALQAAAVAAETADLARLSIDGEAMITRRAPMVGMGLARVAPPPGAFLQPTALGEEILSGLAMDAIAGARRCVDLFSGLGTFALRAAAFAEVLAVESDQAMLDALKAGADGAGGALKQVSVLRRDLLRTPLSHLEMKKFDAAIIDPPRSGARLQAEQLGRAPIRKLAYVSCDPATFARDIQTLTRLGFGLTKVVPVDQFRWSPHVEIVGALER
jgi:23S rRNA (uracil1939-C5)-methyltransferase